MAKDKEIQRWDKDRRKKDRGKKDDLQKHTEKKSRTDEKAAGHHRHEAFCPKCKVWYPSNSNAHAGH